MQQLAQQTTADALPATLKQIQYARKLAIRNGAIIPWDVQQDRRALSQWIERQASAAPIPRDTPSSKQVAFAERIARIKRRAVPDECYKSRDLMSRWITANK